MDAERWSETAQVASPSRRAQIAMATMRLRSLQREIEQARAELAAAENDPAVEQLRARLAPAVERERRRLDTEIERARSEADAVVRDAEERVGAARAALDGVASAESSDEPPERLGTGQSAHAVATVGGQPPADDRVGPEPDSLAAEPDVSELDLDDSEPHADDLGSDSVAAEPFLEAPAPRPAAPDDAGPAAGAVEDDHLAPVAPDIDVPGVDVPVVDVLDVDAPVVDVPVDGAHDLGRDGDANPRASGESAPGERAASATFAAVDGLALVDTLPLWAPGGRGRAASPNEEGPLPPPEIGSAADAAVAAELGPPPGLVPSTTHTTNVTINVDGEAIASALASLMAPLLAERRQPTAQQPVYIPVRPPAPKAPVHQAARHVDVVLTIVAIVIVGLVLVAWLA